MFDSAMKRAWALLTLYLLSLSLLQLIRPTEPLDTKLVLVAVALVNPGVLLFLLLLIRGPSRDVRGDAETRLSTWGWFWRAFVVYLGQIPLLLAVRVVFPFSFQAGQFTAVELLLWEIPFVLLAAIGTWLLFSRDRRGQLRLLFSSLRGF